MALHSTTSRVLCLLLVLAALLQPALRSAGASCGAETGGAAASCCCEPAAPDCHGEAAAPGVVLAAGDCGCSATTPPATPPQRTPWTAADASQPLAPLPQHAVAMPAPRTAAPAPEFVAVRSAREVSLLRLHCVNLI